MQPNASSQCPKCGRPLQKFNGHIGYCSQHKWVSPSGLGYDAEAAEQNRQEAAAAEAKRLEVERQKAEEERRVQQEQHSATIRKVVVVVVALCAIVAAVVFFIVRPSVNYSNATNKLVAGDYESARDAYMSLGNYKDSSSRVLLCEAMIDLQEGRTEDAVAKLDQLTAEGTGDSAKQLAEALLPVMSDWNAKGLSPEAMLLLLSRAEIIDPNGTLDVPALTVEVHTAMLDGSILSTYTEDIDGDGKLELVALDNEYKVTVFRMTDDGNTRISVDNDTAAACQMHFGEGYKDNNLDAAVACFSEAYQMLPNDETRAALTAAYRLRSTSNENADDMEAAISDARSAMETSGAAEDFSFFYEVNLRNCKNGHDAATAIAMWDDFAANNVTEITRYSAKSRWNDDAAQFHLARAAEYAAQKDEGCIDEIRIAAEMGVDVTNAVAEAESHFEPGLSLARLRLMEIDLLGGNLEKEQQIRSDMASEVRTAISEWKTRGISPADVPALIHLADEQEIDLLGISRNSIYEEAALASAGFVTQSSFVDWNHDGYEELLTMDAEGNFNLYSITETWGIASSVDTKLPGATYTIMDETAPLIVIVSTDKDEMLALTGTSKKLTILFREAGISRYAVNGTTITFSRLLEGSIERYNDYTYEAVGTENRPVRTGIDWQQNGYPKPVDAASALQRYFEAVAYDIPDEASLLTADEVANSFSFNYLTALPVPEIPGTVDADAYSTADDVALFEVVYSVDGQDVRAWMAVTYDNGWKVAGAADSYGAGLDASKPDYSVPLISLNAETADTIQDKGGKHTYRMLLPTAGSLSMQWQAGDKAASRNVFNVSLYRDSLASDALITYELQPSPSRQQTKPMFMSAGVYYVTVEARTSDAIPYSLTMLMQGAEHVELESNDTSGTATPVEANTAYTGSLLTSKDVDWYAFAIDETSAVDLELGTAGNGSKSAAYVMTVYSAQDGKSLTSVSVPGNVQVSDTGNLYLSSGSYWIQVVKGSTWTNEAYTVTVNVSQNGAMESESNNTVETANAVPVNEDIHASIGQEGDIDCFSFTLDSDAVVQPKFTFNPTDSNSKTYVLTLYGQNQSEKMKVNIGGKESTKAIAPIALKAGTYTVKVENPRYIRQDYTLRLVSVAAEAVEQEPNDTAALASELTVGVPLTGVLMTESDVDYYKVVFSETTSVTLKFTYPQSTMTSKVFVISVEQNGKSQTLANLTGDSGGTEMPLQFVAGEYYLKVKSSSAWLSSVYQFSLSE